MNFVNVTRLEHTTEVELASGEIANTFHLDFLSFDSQTQDWHVMAEGTINVLEDFLKTVERSREVASQDDAAVFEDTELTYKTSRGGYVIRFSYEVGKEEKIAKAKAEGDARRAAFAARAAAARAAREAA